MPSGLLYDWALPLIALELYDGLPPNDTNIIGKVGYRMAYAALYDADLMQTGILPDPAEHIGIAVESDTLSYKMLLYRYDTFKEDAITNGLIDTLNNQLYDVPNRPDNPYASNEVFMAVPWSKNAILMGKYYFTSDILSNINGDIQNIKVDFGDGNGLQVWADGQVMEVNYNSPGSKDLAVHIRLSDGSVRISRSEIIIKAETENIFNRYNIDTDTFGIAVPGGGGHITVLPFCEGTEEIHKPLIVINGVELPEVFEADFVFLYNKITDFVDSPTGNKIIDDFESGGYDIIFIDWADGSADLKENGDMVRRALHAINERKLASGSYEKNILIGMSMGGVCGKIALREMEIAGEDHEVKTYFTFDSPLRGANFPLGYQYAVEHISGLRIGPSKTLREFLPKLDRLLIGLDSPTPKQMLVYHKDVDPDDPNSPFRVFYNYFKGLGPMQNCEHIAISDGSQIGNNQGYSAGSKILDMNAFAEDGSSRLKARIQVWALPDGGNEIPIYDGKFLIRIFDIPILHDTDVQYSPANSIPLDNAPGGYFPKFDDFIPFNNQFGLGILQFHVCFIPTVSAVGIGPFQSQYGEFSNQMDTVLYNAAVLASGETFVDRFMAIDEDTEDGVIEENNLEHIAFNYDNTGVLLTEILDGIGIGSISTLTTTFNFGEGNGEFDYQNADQETLGLPVSNSGHRIKEDLVIQGNGKLWIAHSGKISYTNVSSNPDNTAEEYIVGLGTNICTNEAVTVTVLNDGILDIGEEVTENRGFFYINDLTNLHIKSAGATTVNYQSELNIEDGGKVVISDGGLLEAKYAGQITIKSGGELTVQAGATLKIHAASQLIVEAGGKLIIEPNANIQLWDATDTYGRAVIDIFGELVVEDEFNFSGNGYFKFEEGHTLTFSGAGQFNFDGSGDTRCIELAKNVTLDIQGHTMNISDGIILYGTSSSISGGEDARFAFSNVIFEGNENATAISASNHAAQLTINGCTFLNFSFAISVFDIFTPLFFIENSTFKNNEISLLIVNGGTVRVSNSIFQGENIVTSAMVLENISSFRLSNSIVEDFLGNAIELTQDIPEFVMSGGFIRNNTVGIHSGLGYRSNVFLRNQATISDNDIGIFIEQGADGSFQVIDYGMVLMDCANLLNNRVGIEGQDVLLQIDAYQNLGNNDPVYLRSNHFQKSSHVLSSMFKICYSLRNVQSVSATGNYWGTNNTTIGMTTAVSSYHNLSWNNNPNNDCYNGDVEIPLTVSSKVAAAPTGCPIAPQNPPNPNPGINLSCILTGAGVFDGIIAHEDYAAAYQAFDTKVAADETTSGIKHLFTELSSISDGERGNANEACKQYIDVSKVMISAEMMKNDIEGNFTIFLSGENPTGEASLQGAKSAKNKLGIHLFPNPAKDVFEIQLPVSFDKETPTYQVEIFDNVGRSVFFEAATNESLSVKTIGWTSGLYHVLLTDKVAGEVMGLKIVVE